MRVLDWAVFSAHPGRLHCSFSYQDGRHVCDPKLVFDLTQQGGSSDVILDDTRRAVYFNSIMIMDVSGVPSQMNPRRLPN